MDRDLRVRTLHESLIIISKKKGPRTKILVFSQPRINYNTNLTANQSTFTLFIFIIIIIIIIIGGGGGGGGLCNAAKSNQEKTQN